MSSIEWTPTTSDWADLSDDISVVTTEHLGYSLFVYSDSRAGAHEAFAAVGSFPHDDEVIVGEARSADEARTLAIRWAETQHASDLAYEKHLREAEAAATVGGEGVHFRNLPDGSLIVTVVGAVTHEHALSLASDAVTTRGLDGVWADSYVDLDGPMFPEWPNGGYRFRLVPEAPEAPEDEEGLW